MPDWKTRLTYAIEKSGLSKAEISRRADIAPQVLNNWLKSNQKSLDALLAVQICTALNINTEWLMTGVGIPDAGAVMAVNAPDPSEHISIKEYALEFGCGGLGGESNEPTIQEVTDSIPAWYRLDYFKRLGINPRWCKRFKVKGDSMSPIILDGDCILVNTDKEVREHIKNNHIYAIWYDGSLFCKYLIKPISGGLIIRSANPDYPDENLSGLDANQHFYIVGEVLERSGSIQHTIKF